MASSKAVFKSLGRCCLAMLSLTMILINPYFTSGKIHFLTALEAWYGRDCISVQALLTTCSEADRKIFP